MPGVPLLTRGVNIIDLSSSFLPPLQTAHTQVAQHGNRPSTQCGTTRYDARGC